MSNQQTSFENKCNILAELWMNYRDEDNGLQFFIEYNDLGLPLAYFIANDLVIKYAKQAEVYINETFDLLLETLLLDDVGFDTLDEMFDATQKNEEG